MKTKKNNRVYRIEKIIQKSVSFIVKYKIKDPRINTLIVSGVKLANNLSYAKIFVIFPNNLITCNNDVDNKMQIVKCASKFIRFLLSKTINLRFVPELNFIHDLSFIKGMRINYLLKQIK